jgi:hypothetical protein
MLSLVSARISLPIIEPLRPSKPCVLPSWQSPFKELILIYGRIIIYSETVTILAGMEEKQSFNVHKDLLAVHSTYFSNLLSEKGLGADEKISIPANASLFADFISWVYFGEFLKVENDALEGEQAVDDLWELARYFQAPAFQNFCMDDCRTYCKASETDPKSSPWPFVEGIKKMYSITPRGSKLRKLAVDSLSYKNPLHENKRGSAVWKEWKALLTGQNSREAWINDLREDFAVEAGTDWNNIPPVSSFPSPHIW